VQIDAIEPFTQFSNNNNQTEQTNDNSSLLLTITDGITTVKGITIDYIPDLRYSKSFTRKHSFYLLNSRLVLISDPVANYY
jgi:hypothetical protein